MHHAPRLPLPWHLSACRVPLPSSRPPHRPPVPMVGPGKDPSNWIPTPIPCDAHLSGARGQCSCSVNNTQLLRHLRVWHQNDKPDVNNLQGISAVQCPGCGAARSATNKSHNCECNPRAPPHSTPPQHPPTAPPQTLGVVPLCVLDLFA
jgi:hypothetical protein